MRNGSEGPGEWGDYSWLLKIIREEHTIVSNKTIRADYVFEREFTYFYFLKYPVSGVETITKSPAFSSLSSSRNLWQCLNYHSKMSQFDRGAFTWPNYLN